MLSITGLVRTLLIIIGVIVLLRFLGQIMNARRNQEAQNRFNKNRENLRKQKEFIQKNSGKTRVVDSKNNSNDVEDVDFEEV